MDTGYFLVVDDGDPAWTENSWWMGLMRARRVLRMFVPTEELANLPGIELSFKVTKAFFEMVESVAKMRESYFKRLETLEEGVRKLVEKFGNDILVREDADPAQVQQVQAAVNALDLHRLDELNHMHKTLDLVATWGRITPSEEQSAIKQVPSYPQHLNPIQVVQAGQRVFLKAKPEIWGKVTCASNTWAEVTWFNWDPALGDKHRDFLPHELAPVPKPEVPKNENALAKIKRELREKMEDMVLAGHFYGLDENGDPIAHPKRFSIQELGEGATMANVVAALKIFPSLSQARKNGFNQPLTLGIHSLTKKRILVEIVP